MRRQRPSASPRRQTVRRLLLVFSIWYKHTFKRSLGVCVKGSELTEYLDAGEGATWRTRLICQGDGEDSITAGTTDVRNDAKAAGVQFASFDFEASTARPLYQKEIMLGRKSYLVGFVLAALGAFSSPCHA